MTTGVLRLLNWGIVKLPLGEVDVEDIFCDTERPLASTTATRHQ